MQINSLLMQEWGENQHNCAHLMVEQLFFFSGAVVCFERTKKLQNILSIKEETCNVFTGTKLRFVWHIVTEQLIITCEKQGCATPFTVYCMMV